MQSWTSSTWPIGGPRPIPESYWVRPGRLLAGEYAGASRADLAQRKIRRLLNAGVTSFVDLTEANEARLLPYAPLLVEAAVQRGWQAQYHRAPIPDMGIPTPDALRATLDGIDAALRAGHCVYVHCWGGIGRTGTVIGCHLVRHGLRGPEALALLARLRAHTPDGQRPSPETAAQREFVLKWDG